MLRGIYRAKGGAVSLLHQSKRVCESDKVHLVVANLPPERRQEYLRAKLEELAVLDQHGIGDREAMRTVIDEMIRA